MKSTWILAGALTMLTAFANAQMPPNPSTPPPLPTATPAPPVSGMNVDAPTPPPMIPFQPNMQPSQQQMPMPPGLGQPMTQPTQSRPIGTGSRPFTPPTNPNIPQQQQPPFNPNAMGTLEKQPQSEIIKVLPPAQRPPEIRAVLRTSVGDITVRLDRLNAPLTVDYFAGLAKGETDFTDIKTSKPVKRPFYNGLIFHRVVKNTLIQSGDPFGNGRGNSGRTIPDELKPSMKFDRPGLIAMAPMRESKGTDVAKGTNSSQFFITLREMPEWNGQYTIFGEVEDGLDVVQKIANSKVGPTERPIKRIYLVAVDILESAK